MLNLTNSISKFQKGKETLDSLFESQRYHGNTYGLGYSNGVSSPLLSHTKFVIATYDASTSSS